MNTPSAVPEDQKCPQCGAALPAGALAGLCPACLLKQGAAGDTVPPVAFVPPSLEELARLFPQLEILALIGTGGMGAVYKARQKELDRVVALKILPPGVGDSPAFAERFTREAKALARLNHPGIVTIHDTGRIDGLYYFLMEFVDGVNLRQLLKTGRLAPREALAIVPQICDALQYAHDAGIVHRDIKPENILLDRQGRVKVADFGLAKLVGTVEPPAAGVAATQSETTKAGQVMGTPQYMAPEQRAHPADVDHRADIYSLGVVFYQMLTGELPGQQLEPPSSRMRGIVIDVRLDEVVLRALEKKPELRYQQASDVKTMVETIVTTKPPVLPPQKNWWQRLHPVARLFIMLPVLLLVMFLFQWTIGSWANKVKARGDFPMPRIVVFLMFSASMVFSIVTELRKERKKRRRWAIVVWSVALGTWLIITAHDVIDWQKKARLVGVWVPDKLDNTIAEQFAPLPLWVTGVSQHKQIVLVDIVCEYRSPPACLWLQFSGPLAAFSSALTSEVSQVSYLMEPGQQLTQLPGPACSKGKTEYHLGFILPDEAAATLAVEQVRRYHIGKPRGLTLKRDWLTLFELERMAGHNTEEQSVRETLAASISWPSPDIGSELRHLPVGTLAFVTSAAGTRPGEICILPRPNIHRESRLQGDEPYLMPDGKRLLYSHQEPIDWKAGVPDGMRNGIYIYDLATRTSTPFLSDPTGSCEQPSCSADGTRIAYVIWPKDRKTSHIWIANADGTGRKQLTTGNYYDWTPRWSPDGRKILFETTRSGKREAYIMDADGQNQISLTPNALIAHSPSWSPDGQRIAFMSHGTNSPANIFVMNADGSNVQNISKGTTRDSEPVWSPDGKWIAFTRTATNPPCPERMDVWIMRSDGTGQQPITHNEPGIWSNGLTWGAATATSASVAMTTVPALASRAPDHSHPIISGQPSTLLLATAFALIFGLPSALGIAWLVHRRRLRRYQQASTVKTVDESIAAAPPNETRPAPKPAALGLVALVLAIAAVLLVPIGLTLFDSPSDHTELVLIFALFFVCEIAALGLGIAARKSGAGIAAVVVSALLLLLSSWIGYKNLRYVHAVAIRDAERQAEAVQHRNAEPKAVVEDATTRALAFGPVIERVLPVGDNSGPIQWLILDSGDIVEHHTSSPSLGVYQRGEILSILTVGHAFHQADYDGNSTPLDIAQVVDNPQNREHATGSGMESKYWTNHFPRAIIFGTPAGKAGLLEFTGFTDNPRGVKIRYKLVQAMVPNAPADQPQTTATTTNALSFGPVIERSLPFEQQTALPFCIDFSSGNVVSPPAGLNPHDEKAWQQWYVQNGVDATAEELTTGPRLVSYEFKCLYKQMESNRWETIKPEAVVVGLQSGATNEVAETRSPESFPAMFLFKTRKGGMGMLQLTGFTDNPRGVKIRYKLVQTAASGLSAAKPLVSADQVAVEDLALQILVAIRDKDDAKLQALATDSVTAGWRDALPNFAGEMRERFQQMTGHPFTMYAGESLVEGNRAVVKCTGPKELNGIYLVLFFVKTGDGWRNWTLHNSPPSTPLEKWLEQKPEGVR